MCVCGGGGSLGGLEFLVSELFSTVVLRALSL